MGQGKGQTSRATGCSDGSSTLSCVSVTANSSKSILSISPTKRALSASFITAKLVFDDSFGCTVVQESKIILLFSNHFLKLTFIMQAELICFHSAKIRKETLMENNHWNVKDVM